MQPEADFRKLRGVDGNILIGDRKRMIPNKNKEVKVKNSFESKPDV